MDHAKLLNKVDHTLLAQGATWEEIRQICDCCVQDLLEVKELIELLA